MRVLLISTAFFMFFAFSCKSDGSSSSIENSEPIDLENMEIDENEEVQIEVSMDEAIKEEDLAKKLILESKKTVVDENAKVEDKNETKLVGKSEAQKKEEEALKRKATQKLINSSVNKGKTCEQILEEQESLVVEFEKSKDRQIILKIAKQKNDPFFVECSEAPEFATKIEEFTLRLEKIIDQD